LVLLDWGVIALGFAAIWSGREWLSFVILFTVVTVWVPGYVRRASQGYREDIKAYRPLLASRDIVALAALWATEPIYRWLGPTFESQLFTSMLGGLALLLLGMARWGANPLAERIGSREKSSLAASVAIVAILTASLLAAVQARNSLNPHNPPALPAEILGYPDVHNAVIEKVLESLWIGTGGGSVYGGKASPYVFSVMAWKTPIVAAKINGGVVDGMLQGRAIRMGPLSCVQNWTGRADPVYRFLPGIVAAVEGVLSGPLASVGDSSPQSIFFWGGPPSRDVIKPPANMACGINYEGITVLAVFFASNGATVPGKNSPLIICQVLDQAFAYYRPGDDNLLSVVGQF
jgi:hypothetical protein